MTRRTALVVSVSASVLTGLVLLAAPADAATTYKVEVTCTVPARQPERQLAPDSCLNYVPDGTQTYTAKVRKADGSAAVGVTVTWSDNATNAHFRLAQNPCTTNSKGVCSAELVVKNPRKGQKVTVTATVGGSFDYGYLTFA
ncbi:hypothetical protein BJM39_02210 [Salmonella enterica subsp. enterica serovar Javiana]|nr:hypothetical protein BJM39_02210 [Salmonella enterica subsp. enterica serovar Javiana]